MNQFILARKSVDPRSCYTCGQHDARVELILVSHRVYLCVICKDALVTALDEVDQ